MRPTLLILANLLALASATRETFDKTSVFPPAVAIFDDNYISCANANWPPQEPDFESGSLLKPQVPDKQLQAALAEVSSDRIKKTITKLVSFGTRHTLSSQTDATRGVGAARDWIAEELGRYAKDSEGRLNVEINGYIQEPTTRVPNATRISNIQATMKGTEDASRYYLTMGHYDTRVSDPLNWWADQPGANDVSTSRPMVNRNMLT
jgi:hypothetical protein